MEENRKNSDLTVEVLKDLVDRVFLRGESWQKIIDEAASDFAEKIHSLPNLSSYSTPFPILIYPILNEQNQPGYDLTQPITEEGGTSVVMYVHPDYIRMLAGYKVDRDFSQHKQIPDGINVDTLLKETVMEMVHNIYSQFLTDFPPANMDPVG